MTTDSSPLPEILRPLFWDVDFNTLAWETDRDWIVRRILQTGNWQSLRWLRSVLGDEGLRLWLETHSGGGLSPRQLRFWELVLNLPSQEVDHWIEQTKSSPWGKRVQP